MSHASCLPFRPRKGEKIPSKEIGRRKEFSKCQTISWLFVSKRS